MDLRTELPNVATHRQGDRRAPHKPLLLLLALAKVQQGERLLDYAEVYQRLKDLLESFGNGTPPRPHYPFWRLQNDARGQIWEVTRLDEVGAPNAAGDVGHTTLLDAQAQGGFRSEVYQELQSDFGLTSDLAAAILEKHFETSLHEEILDAVGFEWKPAMLPPRSPEFRAELIRLYQGQCAMCGYNGQLGTAFLGLEAAHVKWRAYGGPDHPTNGLLLCSLHHKALDRGAMGLTVDKEILVSQHIRGNDEVVQLIRRFSWKSLRTPQEPDACVANEFIDWHRDQVFKDPEMQ